MKPLKSRALISDGLKACVAAASVSLPLVLVDCNAVKGNPRQAGPVLTVEVPPESVAARDDASGVRTRAAGKTSEQGAGGVQADGRNSRQDGIRINNTALNLSYFPNGADLMLEARLSVIRPDGSLDRVILDPEVEFSYADSSGAFRRIAGCAISDHCNAGAAVPAGGPVCVRASFVPKPDSRLDFAQIELTIDSQDIVSYGCAIAPHVSPGIPSPNPTGRAGVPAFL